MNDFPRWNTCSRVILARSIESTLASLARQHGLKMEHCHFDLTYGRCPLQMPVSTWAVFQCLSVLVSLLFRFAVWKSELWFGSRVLWVCGCKSLRLHPLQWRIQDFRLGGAGGISIIHFLLPRRAKRASAWLALWCAPPKMFAVHVNECKTAIVCNLNQSGCNFCCWLGPGSSKCLLLIDLPKSAHLKEVVTFLI